MTISQQTLRKERSFSVFFGKYFLVILAKTYTSHVSTYLYPNIIKLGRKALISRKNRFFGRQNNLSPYVSYGELQRRLTKAINSPFFLLNLWELVLTARSPINSTISQRVESRENKLKVKVSPKHFYLRNDNGDLKDSLQTLEQQSRQPN